MKTINVTDNNISELIEMLNTLTDKNLYLYWLLQEKKDKKLQKNMEENINQILDHYRKQIAKMYMLNIVEQNLTNKEDTQLNLVLKSLKNKLNSKEVMDEYIINGLCLSNLDTIFNNMEDYAFDYQLACNKESLENGKNREYLITAFKYANSFGTKKEIKKKILNIV